MEFFRDTNIDFLGKKWYFLTVTMVLFLAGMASLVVHHGPKMGIDFTGGTQLDVAFQSNVSTEQIRHGLQTAGLGDSTIQPVGGANSHEAYISLPLADLNEQALGQGRERILAGLYKSLVPASSGKQDLNNVSTQALAGWLEAQDPDQVIGSQGTAAGQAHYTQVAQTITTARDQQWHGLVPDLGAVRNLPGVRSGVAAAITQNFFLAPFSLRGESIIGPKVGAQLRGQALRATLYALLGMLIYIAIRFELIYGVAAVVAVFHDVLITLGMFSLARLPISLTVIAAFLTLIGYSMNDTIVVFDRVRENLAILRRDRLADVVNRSINQTLSRTVLTSGLTFLSVLSLLVFGGEVLRGFSFAMTFGILVGTYSSIAVAAPMMVAYIDWRQQRKGQRPAAARVSAAQEKAVRSR